MPHRLLGRALLESGLVQPRQLESALSLQREEGGRLGELLVRHGAISEDDLLQALARQHGMGMASPLLFVEIPPELLHRIPRESAERHGVIPVGTSPVDGRLVLATSEPGDRSLQSLLRHELGEELRFLVAPESLILDAQRRHYGEPRARKGQGRAPSPPRQRLRPLLPARATGDEDSSTP